MPIAQAENADVEIARRDIVEATLDERILACPVAVPDDALVAKCALDGAALGLEVLHRR